MKIVIAVTSPLSYTLIKGQIRYFTDKGAKVTFISSYDGTIKSNVEAEGGNYRHLELAREISFVKDIKSVFRAISLLKQEKPDIINASTPKAGLIFMLASLFMPRSYPIFTLRGIRSDTLTGLKKEIIKFTEYITCKLARKVIIISPSLRDHAIAVKIADAQKTVVLGKGSSNGVNTERFRDTEGIRLKAAAIRRKFAIPPEGVIFGCLGRIVKDKGIIEVYKAFRLLRKKYDGIYLVLTGSVEDADPLPKEIFDEMEANSHVFFINHTNDTPSILSVYDILILFSYREGFGNVVLEASSIARPVIVSDVPGAKDTVVDGVTGFLAIPKDYKDLAKKMEIYIKKPSLRVQHGNSGRERAINYFSSEIIFDGLYQLYRDVENG